MKILVTGANGYIGRHVVDALLNVADTEVVAVDLAVAAVNSQAERIALNIFDEGIDVYAETGKPDVVLHMAWEDGFVHNSQAHMRNLSKHYMFLNNMVDSGCGHVAVMGTMHEVGYWEGAIDEDTPCNPLSQYGVAKNALRQSLALALKDKAVFQWLRAYYIYGDDERAASIFAKITAAVERGDKAFPFNSGKNLYDFISVDELARQIAACVTQTKVCGVINCCTGEPRSLAEQVEAFIESHGFDIKLSYGAFADRPYDSPGVWGDAGKIRQIMGE